MRAHSCTIEHEFGSETFFGCKNNKSCERARDVWSSRVINYICGNHAAARLSKKEKIALFGGKKCVPATQRYEKKNRVLHKCKQTRTRRRVCIL